MVGGADKAVANGVPSIPEREERGGCTDGVLPKSTPGCSRRRLLYRSEDAGDEGAGWGSGRLGLEGTEEKASP